MNLLDAHNHLHDARLAPHLADILPELDRIGVRRAVVNGTREEDWEAVAGLCARHSWALPSFGLHPWHVARRTPTWLEKLRAFLDAHPRAGVGEIGLDRWIEGCDLADQTQVFMAQLALAAERNLPATIHCLRAWGPLWDIVREHPVPARGFLLHACAGPMEMVEGFVKRGAYFSFSPYFLHPRKAAARAVFASIPADRLLVETDAPDMRPPDECNRHPLRDAAGEGINHPANIALAYSALAEVRGEKIEAIEEIVAENFARLFGA